MRNALAKPHRTRNCAVPGYRHSRGGSRRDGARASGARWLTDRKPIAARAPRTLQAGAEIKHNFRAVVGHACDSAASRDNTGTCGDADHRGDSGVTEGLDGPPNPRPVVTAASGDIQVNIVDKRASPCPVNHAVSTKQVR